MPGMPGQIGLGIILFLRQLHFIVRVSIQLVEQTNQTVDLGHYLGSCTRHSSLHRMQISPSSTFAALMMCLIWMPLPSLWQANWHPDLHASSRSFIEMFKSKARDRKSVV